MEQRHCRASLAVLGAREGEERRASSSSLHSCVLAPTPLHAHSDNNNIKYFLKREKTINFAADWNSNTHTANVTQDLRHPNKEDTWVTLQPNLNM